MSRWKEITARTGVDGFLLAIILVVVLAWFFPQGGLIEEPVSLEQLANYGVSGIFFFYGLKLSRPKMIQGLSNWKVHLLVQLTTFVVFPLLILAIHPFFQTPDEQLLWLGIFYLAALPSTVSSSVVMVSIANGNIPAAIFNASISSLLGVFLTPIWVGLFMAADTGTFDPWTIVGKLILQVLVPVTLGILLNKYWGVFAERHKQALKNFDQTIILIIIYTSFCKSFALNLFDSMSVAGIVALAGGMLLLFFCVMLLVRLLSKACKLDGPDTVTAMFCGSKKSLVHGTVMSKVLFSQASVVGIILLPLMIYHALQLVATSIMARRIARIQQEG
jgi:sodium/bile acid cotransporter 7